MSQKLNDKIQEAQNKIDEELKIISDNINELQNKHQAIMNTNKTVMDELQDNIKNSCSSFNDDKNKCLLRNKMNLDEQDRCYYISHNGNNFCSDYRSERSNYCDRYNDNQEMKDKCINGVILVEEFKVK
jgi:hypothetical protein